MAERGFTDKGVGGAVALAAVASMPLVFASGKLIDVIGRRMGAAIIFSLTSLGVVLSYNLHGRWPLTGALVLTIFGTSAVLPVLNAFTSELFPTAMRADAFALANNVLGRTSYVAAPFLVAALAERTPWSVAVSLTAIGPLVAMAVILAKLPETRGLELEDTARV
jgi:putative MFS transporter